MWKDFKKQCEVPNNTFNVLVNSFHDDDFLSTKITKHLHPYLKKLVSMTINTEIPFQHNNELEVLLRFKLIIGTSEYT